MAGDKRTKRIPTEKVKSADYPKVHFDKANDFASIKFRPGVEAKSYLKDGLIICENAKHEVIEVQILNVSALVVKKSTSKRAKSA